MIEREDLQELLDRYGINIDKLIQNKDSIMIYGDYIRIKENLEYLIDVLHLNVNAIERCPSILYFRSKEELERNYHYLTEQGISKEQMEKALTAITSSPEDLAYNYTYLKNRVGKEFISMHLSSLSTNPMDIKKICDILEKNFGKEKLLECFSGALRRYNNYERVERIVRLKVFEDHPELLTPNTFFKSAEEIEKIVHLKVFEDHPELLTPSAFRQSAEEIKKIVHLKVFEDHLEL